MTAAPAHSGVRTQLHPHVALMTVTFGLILATSCSSTGTNAPAAGADTLTCNMPEPIDQVLEIDSPVFAAKDRVDVHFTPCTLDQPNPNALIYLLHGAGADETQWPDVDIFTAADAAVMNGTMPPSVLVTPDAADAYLCSDCADDLLTHLIDEVEPAIERIAPIDPTRRAIGGISHGGGLALEAAGRAPDDFVAVGAHSSVDAPDSALLSIAGAGLPVRLDAGTDDGLAERDERMTQFIDSHGGNAEFVIGPGGHNRDYWRSQANIYIAFYAEHLQ